MFAKSRTAARIAVPTALLAIAFARTGPADEPRVVRERIEWLDVWVPNSDGPADGKPRVLLIGDSIARGYYPRVEEALRGRASVARLTTSKSLGDPALSLEVALVLQQSKFDVIHVNNGLHGWGYTEEEYAAALPGLLATLRERAPGARLIWATTTPVRDREDPSRLDAKTERVRARNAIAARVMGREAIPINDLYSAVIDRPEVSSKDGVHFAPEGTALLADRVAQAVAAQLDAR